MSDDKKRGFECRMGTHGFAKIIDKVAGGQHIHSR